MAVLRVILVAAFMVTVALAKPVNLSEDEEQSNESTEENSSEEDSSPVGHSHHGPLPPVNTPDVIVLTGPSEEDSTPVGDSHYGSLPPVNTPDVIVLTGPSEVDSTPVGSLPPVNTPDIIVLTEPQGTADMFPSVDGTISTNDISVLPDHIDPQSSTDSDTTNIFQDMPVTDPAQDSTIGDVLPDSEVTLHAGLTETHDGTNQPHATTTYQNPPLGTTTSPMSIAMATAKTTVPVCITFQFATSEPDQPRGDSMRRK
ncbi:uncharacterized protein [Labrus bergylta]|uniref:uncharacterized protein n=1 Tax=Labrus bergylta TaxID=56723 RepID=UPI0009B4DC77|nr:pollen-specific leucine-rich repeat extensin-like protein 1 [Labrus bergylta]